MRHADDISDERGSAYEEKHRRMQEWMEQTRTALGGGPTDDPVLFALADTKRRFEIPIAYFEYLITGTTMDVELEATAPKPAPDQPPVVLYRTFDELSRYCWHVASIVGLVCIKIFGYRDANAERLAEQLGLAFQLTNIIRDVKEDAEMGRVYLPQEDLERFQRSPLELSQAHLRNGFFPGQFRELLAFEADRARELYKSSEQLVPMIDHDSQAALWALSEIYRRLLDRISERQYDVFTERVRLGTFEKLTVLGKAMVKRVI
jgi:phytoene synthase